MLASEHQLSVKDQVDGKEESAERGVDQADCFAWNADGHDSENEENDDADKENATASRKVPFGLHGEDGEGQADASADSDGNQNVFRLVEGGDGAEHKSFADGKQREEDNVEWMASSKVIAAGQNNQEDKSHGESDPPHFGMLA